MTGDDWRALAEQLNALGEPFARAGLTLAYHNHNAEFARVEKTNGPAILLERVDPRFASFELDVGWVRAAGIDPADLLLAHPGRFKMIHLKVLSAQGLPNVNVEMSSVPVGSGIIDWKTLLRAARARGRAILCQTETAICDTSSAGSHAKPEFLNALRIFSRAGKLRINQRSHFDMFCARHVPSEACFCRRWDGWRG